jgi:Mce-associated membrane protein
MAGHGDSAVAELSSEALEHKSTTSADADQHFADDVSGISRREHRFRSPVGLAAITGLTIVAVLIGLVGWLAYRTHQTHEFQQQRGQFLEAGRQAAVNLTSIDFNEADKDVSRIVQGATGRFLDDFQKRSQPFIDIVKQAKSVSHGTVSEAGVESLDGQHARVLVAVQVTTSIDGAPEPHPRGWRMRIDVQKVGSEVKVADVQFIS